MNLLGIIALIFTVISTSLYGVQTIFTANDKNNSYLLTVVQTGVTEISFVDLYKGFASFIELHYIVHLEEIIIFLIILFASLFMAFFPKNT